MLVVLSRLPHGVTLGQSRGLKVTVIYCRMDNVTLVMQAVERYTPNGKNLGQEIDIHLPRIVV